MNYFTDTELGCRHCGLVKLADGFKDALNMLRAEYGRPMAPTSCCRCPAHNEHVGGSRLSQHKLGRAADIIVKDIEPDDVANYLDSVMEHGGIGRYSTFTHLDTRTNNNVVGWSG